MARPSLREKLASSAVDTLHTARIQGCSIQDITDAAGVPKGSFFNHFENKEDLAIDSLRRYLEGSRPDMLFDESVPPLQRLKDHFHVSVRAPDLCGLRARLHAGPFFGGDGPRISEDASRNWGRLRPLVRRRSNKLLREAQAKGEVDPRHDPGELARFLVNSWEGATIRLKITQDRQPIDDFLNVAFKASLK